VNGLHLLSAALLALSVEAGAAMPQGSLFVMELKGGARVYALDHPLQKGRILVFHRHPDGIYTSLAADEVERIVAGASEPRSRKMQPGDLKNLGPMAEGSAREANASAPQAPSYEPTVMDDYGYWGYGSGGGRPPRPPRPPAPVPTPLPIGPNGYPIIAPPGTPGSTPPPIGSNGFPIIAPPPPQREPR
jgi:hypothetical protein